MFSSISHLKATPEDKGKMKPEEKIGRKQNYISRQQMNILTLKKYTCDKK